MHSHHTQGWSSVRLIPFLVLAFHISCLRALAQSEELSFCAVAEDVEAALPPAPQVDGLVLFVAFPEDLGTGRELLVSAEIDPAVSGLKEFLDRQGGPHHSTTWRVLADPGNPGRKWIADHNRSWYQQPATWFVDPARTEAEVPFRDCLHADAVSQPVGDFEGYGGHYLGVETLYTVYDGLEENPGQAIPAEFVGIEQFVFVYADHPFRDQLIGGQAIFHGKKGIFGSGPFVRAGAHDNWPCLIWHPALPQDIDDSHITTVWRPQWQRQRWEHIVAHEYGHDLGLSHPSLFDDAEYDTHGEDRYGYGNYSCMRSGEMKDEGFLPHHPWDLLKLGWYQSIPITATQKGMRFDDVRDSLLGRRYHRVELPSIVDDVDGYGLKTYPQYLLLAFHAGFEEDAVLNGETPALPIYRSRGLEVWHVIDRANGSTSKVARRLDLEVASGRFLDPGYWLQPNPIAGLADDTLDYWDARGQFWLEYGFYEGSAGDFFQLTPPAPYAPSPEFSYRTNPNTFAYSEAWINTDQHVANSLFIEIQEDNGNHLIVDILLAPHEEILTPQAGAILIAGAPVTITWDNHRSFDFAASPAMIIDEVDIELSLNDGASWQPIITGLSNNASPTTSGSYEWTPSAAHVSDDCKLRLSYHNIYADPQQEIVGVDETDGTFRIAAPQFSNQSAATGFDWPGEAFASVAMDLDGDTDKDLLISDQRPEESAAWMEHRVVDPLASIPVLKDLAQLKFAPTELPTGLRGLAVADIDNDNDLDFFGASAASPRLYRNSGGTYAYTAVPDANFPQALSTLVGDSWTASFGDYDRNGLVDIYIGRAGATGASADAAPNGVLTDVLLRNDGDAVFSNATSLGIDASNPLATASATWIDIDRDGQLDLLVGSFGTESSKLYRNTLDAAGNRSFVLRSDLLPSSPTLNSVRSVHAADLDNDGDLDLALGHAASAQPGARVLWNNGSGSFTATTNIAAAQPVAASAVLDQNLDGTLDLLLTADVASTTPSIPTLLQNNALVPGQFTDATSAAGLAIPVAKRVTALSGADFGGASGLDDGDLDLYLGRPAASDQIFYQAQTATGADAPTSKWLRVRTRAAVPSGPGAIYLAGNNKDLIGAQVTVQQPSTGTPVWQQTQIVDGGSGYGGQSTFPLTFAIPNPALNAKITVRAPDGAILAQTIGANSYNVQATVADTHSPGLVDASVNFSYEVAEGLSTWTITWFHALSAGFHEVVIFETGYCDIVPGSSMPLRDSMPDVTITSVPVLDGYLVTLIWEGVQCQAACSAQVQVRSYNGATMSQSSMKYFQTPLCGQIQPPE